MNNNKEMIRSVQLYAVELRSGELYEPKQINPKYPAVYTGTILLDRDNKEHVQHIKEIKQAIHELAIINKMSNFQNVDTIDYYDTGSRSFNMKCFESFESFDKRKSQDAKRDWLKNSYYLSFIRKKQPALQDIDGTDVSQQQGFISPSDLVTVNAVFYITNEQNISCSINLIRLWKKGNGYSDASNAIDEVYKKRFGAISNNNTNNSNDIEMDEIPF